jgi:hypothetical protein
MGPRLTTNLTEDQRHDEWARIIRRIAEEHVGQAWSNYMFRLLRAVFNVNRRLAQSGGFLGNWIVGNYVDSTLMHLRRELDRQDGTECLLQLLLDMLDHPTVVTRTRFIASWPANTRDWLADETFSKYAGSSSAGHIDPAMIRADLTRLEEAEALRVHAERTLEQGLRDPLQGREGVERGDRFRKGNWPGRGLLLEKQRRLREPQGLHDRLGRAAGEAVHQDPVAGRADVERELRRVADVIVMGWARHVVIAGRVPTAPREVA